MSISHGFTQASPQSRRLRSMKLVMEPNNALDTMSMADYKVARSLGANETRFGLSDEDGPMLLTDE